MRAAPALQITVGRCVACRIAVTALAAIGFAPLLILITRLHLAPLAAALVTLSGLCAAAALIWRSTRWPSVVLRFDGEKWHLSGERGEAAYRPRRVSVVMDIGTAMLLRFDAEPGSTSQRRRWLPVRARDIGTPWHALRCAVYSPRPNAPLGSTATATDL